MDNFGSSYTHLMIAINNDNEVENGLTSREGNYGDTDQRFQGVTGVIQLKKSQFTSVWINSVTDNSWTIQTESGFSCHFIGFTSSGFHASKDGTQSLGKKWVEV